MTSIFELAERVADAVLYEGYALYPYRPSALKNRVRWQFGVVAPQAPYDDADPWFAQTECLVEGTSELAIRVRCLRPMLPQTGGEWLETKLHTVDLTSLDLRAAPFSRVAPLDSLDIDACVSIRVEPVEGFSRVQLRLENLELWDPRFTSDRNALLAHSMVGAHLLLAAVGGTFVSLLDPPPRAATLAASCENRYTWPVLVGDRAASNLMLSAPITLYDFPATPPQSPADLCDATEIDEILSLRILTLTDEEKVEARRSDPRVRAILDRVDALTAEGFADLHGVMRTTEFFNPPGTPSPDVAFATVNGHRVEKGTHVRLRPNRRADSMDMFLANQEATVAGVYRDVDDRIYVAVTVDSDPAASLHDAFGRYFYFDPTELEPMPEQEHI